MPKKSPNETENEHIRSETDIVPDTTIHPKALQYYGFTDTDKTADYKKSCSGTAGQRFDRVHDIPAEH